MSVNIYRKMVAEQRIIKNRTQDSTEEIEKISSTLPNIVNEFRLNMVSAITELKESSATDIEIRGMIRNAMSDIELSGIKLNEVS